MPTAAAEFAFVILVAVVAAATGWCLNSGTARRKLRKSGHEIRYAREVLGRIHELASHVAADVGEHTSRVEEINEELLSSAADETEAVVSVVDRLLHANSQMQKQLASADEKLRAQARQIESHAAEARTDALTGLANRRAFDGEMARRFAEFQRHGRNLSVMMIDADHFKRLNDAHGHQAGDAVLSGLARVLRNVAREMDVVSRYGGEEFAVVLPGTAVADAGSAAERLRGAIAATVFPFRGAELRVTVSIGVAGLLPKEDTARLIQRADAALYAAKQGGRNCVYRHDGRAVQPIGGEQALRSEKTSGKPDRTVQAQERTKSPHQEPAEDKPIAARAERQAVAPPEPEHDELDCLCDRAALEASLGDRLRQRKHGGAAPTVVLVRIDDYRTIVSGHGKPSGELALRTLLKSLHASIADKEVLARYDVATFGILLRGANLAATVGIAERLRAAIAQCRLSAEQRHLQFTISVSAAAAMDDDSAQGLLRRAEEALDAARKSGGDCSYFHNGQWSEIAHGTVQVTA